MFARARSAGSAKRGKGRKHMKGVRSATKPGTKSARGKTLRKREAIPRIKAAQSSGVESLGHLYTPPLTTPPQRESGCVLYDMGDTPSPMAKIKRRVNVHPRVDVARRRKAGIIKMKKNAQHIQANVRKKTAKRRLAKDQKPMSASKARKSSLRSRLSPEQKKLIKSVCKLLLTPGKLTHLRARRPEVALVTSTLTTSTLREVFNAAQTPDANYDAEVAMFMINSNAGSMEESECEEVRVLDPVCKLLIESSVKFDG